ncbi:hypothetical protein [Apilactobacillus timberlakei]|uniref:hypothetical protein n=1 Tax=Apilactobacillus timberlakei TaxID=2008380 RepID=UPI001CDCF42B|nr:hypothetical protein [Apilactobacillus timberlakei]
MKTANVSDAKLRSQLFRTMLKVNMGITPFDPVDLKYIKPNDLANKINKNTGMNVKSINFDKDTYLYSIKLNDDYSIISDCGYILKSEDVTNIFGSGEELSINSLVSNYAKTMNINYIYKHFLNENNNLTDETNYNYFDSFFIVINNDDYNDNNINELRVKFDKLLSFFKKVATNNINLPMDNYNVAKTIQTINSVHNNNVNFKSFEVSKNLQSVFNLDYCYKNNNFTIKLEFSKDMVGFDNHIMKSIKLGVERVPNEIIKENSVDDLTSKNRAVVVIRDHGSVINAISKKMNVDSMDTRMGIANTIEKSSKGRVRIKSKNHPINTAIPRWNNMFAFDDSELVILGTMDEVVRLLSIFERLIFDVLTYTYDMDQIANTKGIRDKIDILLKSDISAYEISKNFDIAGNKITQLRRGTTHLDRLSFGNAEKLTRAFDFYAQKGLLGGNSFK